MYPRFAGKSNRHSNRRATTLHSPTSFISNLYPPPPPPTYSSTNPFHCPPLLSTLSPPT
ncbi:hypothetical protein KC345_g330, partial [Hortaea werneckii]